MTGEDRESEIQTSDFDVSLVQPTEQDWAIISGSRYTPEPSERCYILGDIALLDPKRKISTPTKEDWDWFVKRTIWLNESNDRGIVRNPLITEMAKVDREKAVKALNPGELQDIYLPALRKVLKGEAEEGLYPGSLQEFLIYTDPGNTKRLFREYGNAAWNSEKRYVSWLRRESPGKLFTLLAALSEISQDQTLSLLEKSDWGLAQEGLAHYRKKAAEYGGYQTKPLITHLAALKKLTPLFEQLFHQEDFKPKG